MSDIGELSATALELLDVECPFCNSEAGKKLELTISPDAESDTKNQTEGEYILSNESGKLRDNLGGGPTKEDWAFKLIRSQPSATIQNGSDRKTTPSNFYAFPIIHENYQINDDGFQHGKKTWSVMGVTRSELWSWPSPNAHHLIPGNESLKACKELLKWMAKTVKWKSVTYKDRSGADDTLELGDAVPADVQQQLNQAALEQSSRPANFVGPARYPTRVTSAAVPKGGGISEQKMYALNKGEGASATALQTDKVKFRGVKITTLSTEITSAKITGIVDYDINSRANGVWLPGHNAVKQWAAWPDSFKKEYIDEAINKTGSSDRQHQFHDTHQVYSKQVKKYLNQIAKKLEQLSKNCIAADGSGEHKKHRDEDLPAPTNLTVSLDELSACLEKKLTGKRSSWKMPFITSAKYKKFFL